MTKSPLQFAKDFARLQGQLVALPSGDGQLLLLLNFWQEMREYQNDSAYRSYFDEYLPLLMQSIGPANLADLCIAELVKAQSILTEIQDAPALVASLDFGSKLNLVTVALVKVYFYVGAVDEGLAMLPSPLARLPEGEGKSATPVTEDAPPLAVGFDLSREPLLDELESTNEFSALQTICIRATETNHPLAATLSGILTEWQGEREEVRHDRARCLFVERDNSGGFVRGRLRTLVGKVDLFGKSARTDEITFENVIKSPDDPFVGVAYNALAAMRKVFQSGGLKTQGLSYYHAHFSIADSGQTFTGDSIGLAFGLLAYVQLLRPEVLRLDRLLSGEVAFTGGVDTDGRLTAVNDETLGQKIERAFFSPVKYVALPEANAAAAKQHLDRLRAQYPRRNLHLIAAERLSDIVEDHNIVRSEKVCIGEFVAKKAAKYGRMTKVQVPLLLALGYLLLCLIYPRAWVGFDWNPAQLKADGKRLEVSNKSEQLLWSYEFPDTFFATKGSWEVTDLDDDNRNEVLIAPFRFGYWSCGGMLYAFDDDGDSLFARDCTIRGEYPGDTIPEGQPMATEGSSIYVCKYRGEPMIITRIVAERPGRSHIRFWDGHGNGMGKYICAGYSDLWLIEDVDGDGSEEAIFAGANNRLNCTMVFMLDPATADGVSPPYADSVYDLRWVIRGNQRFITFFRPSQMNRHFGPANYQTEIRCQMFGLGVIDVIINEGSVGSGLEICHRLSLDSLRAKSVLVADPYEKKLLEMMVSGYVAQQPISAWQDSLLHHVTYFIDGKYVTEGELQATER